MNDTANVTLPVSALPVMAHAREEVAEMVEAADALVLNYGTLTPEWVESMLVAGRRANEHGIPVVIDRVGAGATSLRLLRELDVTIVRGNAGVVRGVESVAADLDAAELARQAAEAWTRSSPSPVRATWSPTAVAC